MNMFSPQSVTEIPREGWNRNDEGLAAADETADYDGIRDPIEPWNGAAYAVDKKKVSSLLSADTLQRPIPNQKNKRNPSSVETVKSPPMLSVSVPISNNSNTTLPFTLYKNANDTSLLYRCKDFHDIVDRLEELEKKVKEVVGNVSVTWGFLVERLLIIPQPYSALICSNSPIKNISSIPQAIHFSNDPFDTLLQLHKHHLNHAVQLIPSHSISPWIE